ncbi:MAG: glycosyltransferase family 4 protein [Myxococcaceae bacterium]|nr:MAG: glycosyltransferase family 4 protein [Myxococcaceae bacterium]
MKIAQVAPLTESVPPRTYGGTERVVSYLTEELVAQGHDVTLFASGDSTTRARLVAPCSRALRLDPDCRDPLAVHFEMFEMLARRAAGFDIIHFHTGYWHVPFMQRTGVPFLTTLHGRLDLPEVRRLHRCFDTLRLVPISESQRQSMADRAWLDAVHNGVPSQLYRQGKGRGGYLAFVGRISPEKRPDRAIEIALRAGMRLRIAAKVDRVDQRYFDEQIRPLLDTPGVEYLGELDDAGKADLLGHAEALLFPIDWPEPFGMVMIEAMACGTPVIAFAHGSVPEIVRHGETGFLVSSVEEAVRAVDALSGIERARCRAHFERHFTATLMARRYVERYQALLEGPAVWARPAPGAGWLSGGLEPR